MGDRKNESLLVGRTEIDELDYRSSMRMLMFGIGWGGVINSASWDNDFNAVTTAGTMSFVLFALDSLHRCRSSAERYVCPGGGYLVGREVARTGLYLGEMVRDFVL